MKPDMKPYIGVKAIRASEPITKKEYCDYRGWTVPEDENPEAMVRLVEYQPDPESTPNHPNHEGYISMSPQHVFDDAYMLITDEFTPPSKEVLMAMPEHQQRVMDEAIGLAMNIFKLTQFRKGDVFKKLPKDEQSRLKQQGTIMVCYLSILKERIENF